MEWLLWICITGAASGACMTEKFWRVQNSRAECEQQLRGLRVEPSPSNINIASATVVEMAASAPPGRVIAACVLATPPAAPAVAPAAPVTPKPAVK